MVSILQVYVPFKLNFIQHILFMPITTKAINFFSIYAFVSIEYHWFIHWPTAATLWRFLVFSSETSQQAHGLISQGP